MFAVFLTSGLFLGWSLGANDAANVFGTAVGTRMISFRRAAILCGVFVVLGAVISGAGAAETLGDLGAVNAIAGAFVVALAAAITVYWLTVLGYPVSTTQAIVGAIIGWDLFSGALIDYVALIEIVASWVVSPILAGIFAVILYKLIAKVVMRAGIHMFKLDALTRYGLIIAGVAGAYSLGANNIANVVGVFIPVSPFQDLDVLGLFKLTAAQQLFFIGAVAIAVGTFTYGKRVMLTVGEGIADLLPVAALVAVLANALVLFLFASQGLEAFLIQHGIPPIPLVPVSSSQAIVGAVLGIGLIKGGRAIRWRMVGGIVGAWAVTPVAAVVVSFFSLFIVQNVFQQRTFTPVEYAMTEEVMQKIEKEGISTAPFAELQGRSFPNAFSLDRELAAHMKKTGKERKVIMSAAEIAEIKVTAAQVRKIKGQWFTPGQIKAVEELKGQTFVHKWMFNDALAALSPEWRMKDSKTEKEYNAELSRKLDYLHRLF
ncbi:MAG: inorganic phosphate transporter [Syntrophales bacterium]|jgi:PiT family inorganic phosphate transporter|nr:inorganic phosphate transporter [Syntrophales bacterium]